MKRKGDASIMKPEDIGGKTIGEGKATAQLAQTKAFGEKQPGGVKVKEYVGFNEAYADLAAGRVVAVGNSLPNIAFVAKQRPDTFEVVLPTFGVKTYFGFIGRKEADYKTLDDAVDAALLKIKKDGRMAKMQQKWFGTTFDTPDTAAGAEYLKPTARAAAAAVIVQPMAPFPRRLRRGPRRISDTKASARRALAPMLGREDCTSGRAS